MLLDDVDRTISAEIPDREMDPKLYKIVTTCMIHSHSALCMENGRCRHRFPKPFTTVTMSNDDGYPAYHRCSPEDGGNFFVKVNGDNEFLVTNAYVVPHNPMLSQLFDAHINVEMCSSIKVVQYITKYLCKGSDAAMYSLDNPNNLDEIKSYQLGRYVSSNEAAWRIYGFPIHDHSPPITRLDVHLPNGQRVVFNPERDSLAHLVAEPRATKLTAFFELNQTDPVARTLLYVDIPKHFRWVDGKWRTRQKQPNLGRVYNVHPKDRECFMVRLLLSHRRGPTSFDDLKTVDGVVCATFEEAAERLGILESDSHWENTLLEASTTMMPRAMRAMFSVMIAECNLSRPQELWDKFKEAMSHDILRQERLLNPEAEFDDRIANKALIWIEDLVVEMKNQRLHEYGLRSPDRENNDVDDGNRMIERETSYDRDELADTVETRQNSLTPEQRSVFDRVMALVESGSGGFVFLDAPGMFTIVIALPFPFNVYSCA